MSYLFPKFFSYQTVIATAMIFIVLDAVVPLNFSHKAETSQYPFKLAITLEKTTYKLGEPVNITWILINIGEQSIGLIGSVDHFPDFIIRDQNFNHVYRWTNTHLFADVKLPFKIQAGSNITIDEAWKQIYDEFETVHPPKYKKVAPGTYFVSGVFESPSYNVKVTTPETRIAILWRLGL